MSNGLCCVNVILLFQNEYILSYKQSRRREDDLAIVNAGLRVVVKPMREGQDEQEDGNWKIVDCSLSYGGMSFKTLLASKTQQALIGRYIYMYVYIHSIVFQIWWYVWIQKLEWSYIGRSNSSPIWRAPVVPRCSWRDARVSHVPRHIFLLQVLPHRVPPPVPTHSAWASSLCHSYLPQVSGWVAVLGERTPTAVLWGRGVVGCARGLYYCEGILATCAMNTVCVTVFDLFE